MKALVSVCLFLLAVPAAAVSPAVSFETGAVMANGVSPQGRVVWFSVAREISRQAATIVLRGDLLLVIDPNRMTFLRSRIGS